MTQDISHTKKSSKYHKIKRIMEEVKEKPILYFSLLPRDINTYILHNYLSPNYDAIWYPFFGIQDTSLRRYLHRPNHYYDSMISATNDGYIKILKYIREKEPSLIENNQKQLFRIGCENNHADIVKWLHKKYKMEIINDIVHITIRHGSLDVLKYIHGTRGRFRINVWLYASQHGHIHILEWIIQENILNRRVSPKIDRYEGALGCCNVETIKWIRNAGFPWKENMLHSAMNHRNYAVMEWLLTTDCPKTEKETRDALMSIEQHNQMTRIIASFLATRQKR